MAYFGDGSKYGLHIGYSREEKPLGTAGPLGLVSGLDEPFLVMNGDLLTTLDYRAMWEHHVAGSAVGTLATFQRTVNIDLGVIETNDRGLVKGYIEKPSFHYTVSTGVYVFDPLVLGYVASGERMDLPDLILKLLEDNREVFGYRFDGYWLDIGRQDDYEQAIVAFEQHRSEFLPEG
jgi:NDP-sugar pyrophosphorylase family protein